MGFREGITAALLLLFSEWATAENETQMIADISGEITIDANGAVNDVSLSNLRDTGLRKMLADTIASWEFHPVSVNGVGVKATVPIQFNLIATSGSKRKLKQLEFANIAIGQSTIEKEIKRESGYRPAQRPRLSYPRNALISGAEAIVLVAVIVGEDGSVRDAAVYELSIINAEMPEARTFARAFHDEALDTISQFRWTPEQLTEVGCVGGCTATVSANFIMEGAAAWRSYKRMPVKTAPWVVDVELKDMDDSDQSQLVRLKEDPTGKPIEIGG